MARGRRSDGRHQPGLAGELRWLPSRPASPLGPPAAAPGRLAGHCWLAGFSPELEWTLWVHPPLAAAGCSCFSLHNAPPRLHPSKAPEVLAGERAGAPADCYSFGLVLWELLVWQLPWRQHGCTPYQVSRQGRPRGTARRACTHPAMCAERASTRRVCGPPKHRSGAWFWTVAGPSCLPPPQPCRGRTSLALPPLKPTHSSSGGRGGAGQGRVSWHRQHPKHPKCHQLLRASRLPCCCLQALLESGAAGQAQTRRRGCLPGSLDAPFISSSGQQQQTAAAAVWRQAGMDACNTCRAAFRIVVFALL